MGYALVIRMNRINLQIILGIIKLHCLLVRMAVKWVAVMPEFYRMFGNIEKLETVKHIVCHSLRLQSREG